MTTRPDLDAIERFLDVDEQMDRDLGLMPQRDSRAMARKLLTYCRELEEESKLLAEQNSLLDKALSKFNHIDPDINGGPFPQEAKA